MVPTSNILLCRYHIIKNARGRLKHAVGTEQIKGEEKEMIKFSVILESIMIA